MEPKQPSKSRELAAKVIFAAFQILQEKGGEAPGREVINEIEQRVTLDAWAKTVYEKTGNVRWKSMLHFFSIDCIKAGYLVKKNGVWYLTDEGEEALKLGERGLLDAATAAYRVWAGAGKAEKRPEEPSADEPEEQGQEATLHAIEQSAIDGLRNAIARLNPYEFQELVAGVLRGMGYFTPFVAPKGKDGGIDIIAYRDPLGTISPRIRVQVKHRIDTARVEEVRQLIGVLRKDGDVGMFVSSGGFTADAKAAARDSHVHVELIDLDRLISLWQDFYGKLSDEDKSRLPLTPIYFYSPAL